MAPHDFNLSDTPLFCTQEADIHNSLEKCIRVLILVNSNLTGESLLVQLNLFEKEHTEDFRSKIDLANYFILIGDYNSCYEYLIRAESVIKNCPKGKEGKR